MSSFPIKKSYSTALTEWCKANNLTRICGVYVSQLKTSPPLFTELLKEAAYRRLVISDSLFTLGVLSCSSPSEVASCPHIAEAMRFSYIENHRVALRGSLASPLHGYPPLSADQAEAFIESCTRSKDKKDPKLSLLQFKLAKARESLRLAEEAFGSAPVTAVMQQQVHDLEQELSAYKGLSNEAT